MNYQCYEKNGLFNGYSELIGSISDAIERFAPSFDPRYVKDQYIVKERKIDINDISDKAKQFVFFDDLNIEVSYIYFPTRNFFEANKSKVLKKFQAEFVIDKNTAIINGKINTLHIKLNIIMIGFNIYFGTTCVQLAHELTHAYQFLKLKSKGINELSPRDEWMKNGKKGEIPFVDFNYAKKSTKDKYSLAFDIGFGNSDDASPVMVSIAKIYYYFYYLERQPYVQQTYQEFVEQSKTVRDPRTVYMNMKTSKMIELIEKTQIMSFIKSIVKSMNTVDELFNYYEAAREDLKMFVSMLFNREFSTPNQAYKWLMYFANQRLEPIVNKVINLFAKFYAETLLDDNAAKIAKGEIRKYYKGMMPMLRRTK